MKVMENIKEKLNFEEKKFLNENIGLMMSFYYTEIRKNTIPNLYRDDFLSNLGKSFCKAVKTYDSKKGASFSTYVYELLNNSKIDLLRKIKRHKKNMISSTTFASSKVFYKDFIKKNDAFENCFIDESNNKQLNWQILEKLIKKANLSKVEKNYLEHYYFDELNYRQIGEKFNLSHERIRQVVEKALKKIKDVALKEDYRIEDFYEIG